KGLSEELRREIGTKIGEGAGGMFRWAACQMDSVALCKTPNAVRKCLLKLPDGLDETYDRMLESIHPDDKSDSIRLLQFILHSELPLTPAEAVEILATRPDERQDRHRFQPENRLFKSSWVEKYCPGIISIVSIKDEQEPGLRWEEVHLTHFTVKEYLQKISTFCQLKSSIAITQVSLAYLTDIGGPYYRMCVDFPLAARAADVWSDFAMIAQSDKKTVEITVDFLFAPEMLSKLYRISNTAVLNCNRNFESPRRKYLFPAYRYWNNRYWSAECFESATTSGLHYACKRGLRNTTLYMMEDPRLNLQQREKGTCMVAAILCKHVETAKVLLEHDVSPDSSHPWHGFAIIQAASLGLDVMVRLLIEAGADVNIDGGIKDDHKTALCAASESGNLETVRHLLEAGADYGLRDFVLGLDNRSPLQIALERGDSGMVKLLMDKGSCKILRRRLLAAAANYGEIKLFRQVLSLNPSGSQKTSALSIACEAGRVEIVRLLLSKGTKIGHDDRLDHCLVRAVNSGNERIVKMLLSHGYDDDNGCFIEQSLLIALMSCHQTLINLLIDALGEYAHLNVRQKAALRAASEIQHHQTLQDFVALFPKYMDNYQDFQSEFKEYWIFELLYETLFGDHKDLVQSLLKEAYYEYFRDHRLSDAHTPIEIATLTGNAVAVAQLINAGVDIHVGEPLYLSVREGHENVIQLLLKHNVDVNSNREKHLYRNPLSFAISHTEDNSRMAHILLDHGADYNLVDVSCETAIHHAARYGKVSLVVKLLKLGEHINKRDRDGKTPLHLASKDVVPVLVASGADINARDSYNRTPLHDIASKGLIHEMRLLLRSGAEIFALTNERKTILHAALESSDSLELGVTQVVKFLLDSGLDAAQTTERGLSPLHYACSSGHLDAAALLLKKGVDVNGKDAEGKTPFFYVAAHRQVVKSTVDLLALLVDQGADVNIQDKNGCTALHYCATQADMAELLLDHGVDIDAQNGEGETALFQGFSSYFFFQPQQDAAKLLIERGTDLNIQNNFGQTVLHKANNESYGLCKIMLDRGANVNALDKDGDSPLRCLLRRGKKAHWIAELLVEKGGKNIRDGKEGEEDDVSDVETIYGQEEEWEVPEGWEGRDMWI
ncbi:hypothetical protein IL306_008713, partial [Fusarium sp. DS 682]